MRVRRHLRNAGRNYLRRPGNGSKHRTDMRGRAAILLAIAVFAAGCAAPAPAADSASTSAAADSVLSDKLVVETLASDVEGLSYTSETDAPYDVLTAPGVDGPIDADAVRAAFQRETLVGAEVRDFDDWFAQDLSLPDGADESEVTYVAQMTKARDAMRASLSDLTVVLLSESSFDDGNSVGDLEIFVVGRSRETGALIALHTLAVWT